MKRGIFTGFVFILCAAFVIPAGWAQDKKPIKIGVPMTLSGMAAQVGVDNKNGIVLAAKEKKTILGRPIELLIEDEEGKPEVGVRKAEKMVNNDGVVALLGVAFSGVGLAVAEAADKMKIPFLTTNVMTPKLYGISKYVFRAGQLTDDQTAVAHVVGIKSDPDLKNRTYYVLADDYAWGHSCSEEFIALGQKQGIKIHNAKYDNAALNVTDWSPFISKISASGANGMYSCLRSPVVPRFTKQASEFGLMKKIKVVAGGSPSEADLEAGGEAEIGIVTACAWTWDMKTPASQKFAKAYWEEFKAVPPSQGAQAYVGAMILFHAFEKAGSTDPEKIVQALKGASYDGPYGVVRISPKDNSMRTPAVLTETVKAPANPYGAKIMKKILVTLKPEEIGPPE
ncbi:MAG TPA: ABC transporter substrate-binding protein [Thermodesulfobacteriota bacterium]|nr:ABC transporter substrate-binding protein [Thermodesulfobacteriota bacterium]